MVLRKVIIVVCFLSFILFLFGSTIILSLIPLYLPSQSLVQTPLTISALQTILLRLSSNGILPVGTILDISIRMIVQNQMQTVLLIDTTASTRLTVRVLNATSATFSRRKRRESNNTANGLFVTYELTFPRSCALRCQSQMLALARTKFISLIIVLNFPSAGSEDEVTNDIRQISAYWANIRPYADNPPTVFGVTDIGLPDGCQVEQVHVLHRHGSRYPTSDSFDGGSIQRFAEKVAQIISINGASFNGPLSFLNTWSLRLSEALLVPTGAAQEYQSGTDFWNQYGRILYNAQPGQSYYNESGYSKPLFRSTSIQRNYESTLIWASGFFGPLNTTDKYSLLSIPADTGSNNTLYGALACRNLVEPFPFTFNENNLYNYLSIVLLDATVRLSAYTPANTIFTYLDVFAMQSLCAYEYAALGSSDFCSLFTLNEWRGFEQGLNLAFYNTYAFGNGTGRAQGIGYVEELIARLNHRLIPTSDSSVNSTLDSSANTFPLNQLFYVDMSHDNNIASVLAALSIDYFRENLTDTSLPPSSQHYHVSRMTPFAARLITEQIGCISSTPLATNSTRTQYTPSQYGYTAASATYKFIRMRLNSGILPLDTIRDGFCSVGRTDGLCPMANFFASQSTASAMANFQYVCFGNYTVDANTVITDGTLFA